MQNLHIRDNKELREIKNEFNSHFPHLKII
jgi:hypothetical protein